MVESKKKIRRFVLLSIATALLLAALGAWLYWRQATLQDRSFRSGYILLGMLFFLAAYNLRKKLPFLPMLGSSRAWMQAHIFVGWATLAVFLMHLGFRIPDGRFESFLALLYLIVAGSGIYGLYMTRTIPRKLTLVSMKDPLASQVGSQSYPEPVYEQIPWKRQELVVELREMMQSVIGKSETLARFYANRLLPFFEQPRPVAYHLMPSTRQCSRLENEVRDLNRFLSPDQRGLGGKLIEMIRRKDNLDYHRTMQGRLKYWLFLHIGFTYSLLLVAVIHGIMAHAFHGGMR